MCCGIEVSLTKDNGLAGVVRVGQMRGKVSKPCGQLHQI